MSHLGIPAYRAVELYLQANLQFRDVGDGHLQGRLRVGFCDLRGARCAAVVGDVRGRVDVHRGRRAKGLWRASDEALGVPRVRLVEHTLSSAHHARRVARVDLVRREVSQTRVAVLLVVPVEEAAAEAAGLVHAVEAVWELRQYFSVLNWASEPVQAQAARSP